MSRPNWSVPHQWPGPGRRKEVPHVLLQGIVRAHERGGERRASQGPEHQEREHGRRRADEPPEDVGRAAPPVRVPALGVGRAGRGHVYRIRGSSQA